MTPKYNTWEECISDRIITKTEPDIERSNSLKNMAKIRFEFWNNKVDDKYSSLKIEGYYETIKELIYAHLYKNGYNCSNHICLISYLKNFFLDFDFEIFKIDELRQLRNDINYRGFDIKKEYLEKNELEFKEIIKKLEQEI